MMPETIAPYLVHHLNKDGKIDMVVSNPCHPLALTLQPYLVLPAPKCQAHRLGASIAAHSNFQLGSQVHSLSIHQSAATLRWAGLRHLARRRPPEPALYATLLNYFLGMVTSPI